MWENFFLFLTINVDDYFFAIIYKIERKWIQITNIYISGYWKSYNEITIKTSYEWCGRHIFERNDLYIWIFVLNLRQIPKDEVSESQTHESCE